MSVSRFLLSICKPISGNISSLGRGCLITGKIIHLVILLLSKINSTLQKNTAYSRMT